MKFRAIAAAAAALAMTTTPVLAQASQAQPASEVSRSVEAPAGEESNLDDGTVALIAAAVIGLGVVIALIASDDDDDGLPTSP